GFKSGGHRTGRTAAKFRGLRRFATRVAIAGGLFREALALAQRFPQPGLVAAIARLAQQGAPGGTGVSFLARQTLAADRTGRVCKSGSFRPGPAGCPARAIRKTFGSMAVPTQTVAP